ncbi:MAG TPA: M23 family metallopeptidase [Candidatus Dormibacteraeota bacterium]|nr:M23 family metallopeptidase [Candidatus Dormibacteraeota bacterium]
MPLPALRIGLFAWDNRRSGARVLVAAVAAIFALPVVLALVVVAALAGSATAATPPSHGVTRPMAGWVLTQPYGCTGLGFEPPRGACPHFHFGIDLAAPAGTAVVAVLPGQAEVFLPAGYGGGYGLHVVVHHADGLATMYAHLQEIAVFSGQQVSAGTVLGREGSTGMSTGPHLHFEAREAGIAVDPVSVFPGMFGPEGQPQ